MTPSPQKYVDKDFSNDDNKNDEDDFAYDEEIGANRILDFYKLAFPLPCIMTVLTVYTVCTPFYAFKFMFDLTFGTLIFDPTIFFTFVKIILL